MDSNFGTWGGSSVGPMWARVGVAWRKESASRQTAIGACVWLQSARGPWLGARQAPQPTDASASRFFWANLAMDSGFSFMGSISTTASPVSSSILVFLRAAGQSVRDEGGKGQRADKRVAVPAGRREGQVGDRRTFSWPT